MWVEIIYGNSAFKIFNEYDPSKHFPVFSEMHSQSVGLYVCKGGIATGETCGWIECVNMDCQSDEYGTLYDQVLAPYTENKGDSGVQVYHDPLDTWIRNWRVKNYGVVCKDRMYTHRLGTLRIHGLQPPARRNCHSHLCSEYPRGFVEVLLLREKTLKAEKGA